ncbi:MAG: chemotaxis protein CheW [Candidatus Marinimicrobia bacterium]|nr:chemotaxis protein CheW [Candidatus Neomarinimicrobiota bacterium]
MNTTQNDTAKELTIFQVADISCGLDIADVQEINKHVDITKAFGAPDYVRGIINLRGEIVTVIDLRQKFGIKQKELNEKMRVVIVESQGENMGLLVDRIDDIVVADPKLIEPPPSNVSGVTGEYFTGILKTDTALISILDIHNLLSIEKNKGG